MVESALTKYQVVPIITMIVLVVAVIIVGIVLIQKLARSVTPPTNTTIAISPVAADSALSNFYIMASYNTCASGDSKNDFVSLAPLVNVIANGCRFLDFEVYDVNGKAVVAVSPSPNFNFKGSFNSIPLVDVLTVVSSQAVNASNARDPLFLQFRIKSNEIDICNQLAKNLQTIFGQSLLTNKYTYNEDVNSNFGEVKLKELIGKVVISVDMSNKNVKNSMLAEFVNIPLKKPAIRLMTSNDVAFNTPSDIIDGTFQNQYLVMCVPDVTKPDNYDSSAAFKLGIQIIAMQFQTHDNNLDLYMKEFDSYAFKLKPEDLQYEPTVITPAPTLASSDQENEDNLNASGNPNADNLGLDLPTIPPLD